jgi:hypothetical protein
MFASPHKYKIITQIKAYSGGGAGGVSVAVVAPRRRGLCFNHVHGPSRNLWLEHLELLPLQVLARVTGLAGIHHFLRKQKAKQIRDENSNFVIKMMTNAIQLISWFAAMPLAMNYSPLFTHFSIFMGSALSVDSGPLVRLHSSMLQHAGELVQAWPLLDVSPSERTVAAGPLYNLHRKQAHFRILLGSPVKQSVHAN